MTRRAEELRRRQARTQRANTAMIVALATEGWAATDIAAEFSLPDGYVHTVLSRAGLLLPDNPAWRCAR